METADPRAELIRKWSIESPGLMAEAGLSLAQEGFTLEAGPVRIKGVTTELKNRKKKAKAKKGEHGKKGGHGSSGSQMDVLKSVLSIMQHGQHSTPQAAHHKTHEKKHKSKKQKLYAEYSKKTDAELKQEFSAHFEKYQSTLGDVWKLSSSLPKPLAPTATAFNNQAQAIEGGRDTDTVDDYITKVSELRKTLKDSATDKKGYYGIKHTDEAYKNAKYILKGVVAYNGYNLMLTYLLHHDWKEEKRSETVKAFRGALNKLEAEIIQISSIRSALLKQKIKFPSTNIPGAKRTFNSDASHSFHRDDPF